jgi:hypothetical protein
MHFMRTFLVAALLGAALAPDAGAIAGGRPLQAEEVPSSVMRLYVDSAPRCGAALIGENAVVTAAHCVVDQSGKPLRARRIAVAPGRPRDPRRPRNLVPAVESLVPKGATTTRYAWDLALVVLSGAVDRDEAELPPPWLTVDQGRRVELYGYGPANMVDRRGANRSGILRVGQTRIREQGACLKVRDFKRVWAKTQMRCVGARGSRTDTCAEDSGGPVYAGEQQLLVGLISFSLGTSCTTTQAPAPSVLARTDCGALRTMIDKEFLPELTMRIDNRDAATNADVVVTLADGRTFTAPAVRDPDDRRWLRASVELPDDLPDGEEAAFEIRSFSGDPATAPMRRRRGEITIFGRTWAVVGPAPRVADGCPAFPPTPVTDETHPSRY